MTIGLYFGVPLLPMLVVFALLQSGVAYLITRNQVAIRIALSVAITATGSFLIVPMLTKQPVSVDFPFSIEWLNYVTFAVASTGLIWSTIIGLIGGPVASSKNKA